MKRQAEISCHESALSFLARRPHFRVELERKLGRRYDANEVEEALARLAGDGLVDDLACARAFCDGPMRRKGYGPIRIRHDLMRRGAGSDIAAQVTGEAFADGDLDAARAAAERWRERSGNDDASGAGLARHLERKGFTAASIRAVLHRDGD